MINSLNCDEKTDLMNHHLDDNSLTLVNKFISIDEIFNKIGYTRYHVLVIMITAITLFADGAEIYNIYLISPILIKEYNLSKATSTFMSSSIFIGFGIGSFFSGTITNLYQRRLPMQVSLIIIMFFGTVWVFIDNIWFYIFCRVMIGLGIGILMTFLNSLCEILPLKYRDLIMGSIFVFMGLGTIYFCLICYIFMGNQLDRRYWKKCNMLSVLPNVLSFVLLFFYNESPRFLMWNNNLEQGFIELEKLAAYKNIIITEEEKNGIRLFIRQEKVIISYSLFKSLVIIFSSPLTRLTIIVLSLWFLNSCVYYLNAYSLPFILNASNNKENIINKKHNLILELLFTNLIPIPAHFSAGPIASIPFFGRKYSIAIGFFFQIIFSSLMCFHSDYLYIYSSLVIFFHVISQNITRLYTSEAYHTIVRDSAYGFGNTMSRIAGFLVPFIAEAGFTIISINGPIYMICLLCLISFITTLFLPFDTYGKALDGKKFDNDKEKN